MHTLIMALLVILFIVSGVVTLASLASFITAFVLSRRHHWSCSCGAEGALWASAESSLPALVAKAVFCHDNLLIKERVPALFDICRHRISVHYRGSIEEPWLSFDREEPKNKEA